jgi:hypothetical protein
MPKGSELMGAQLLPYSIEMVRGNACCCGSMSGVVLVAATAARLLAAMVAACALATAWQAD